MPPSLFLLSNESYAYFHSCCNIMWCNGWPSFSSGCLWKQHYIGYWKINKHNNGRGALTKLTSSRFDEPASKPSTFHRADRGSTFYGEVSHRKASQLKIGKSRGSNRSRKLMRKTFLYLAFNWRSGSENESELDLSRWSLTHLEKNSETKACGFKT